MNGVRIDAGWYSDPYGSNVQRYHDGDTWTRRTRIPGSTAEIVEPAVRLRPTALRILLTLSAAVLAVVVPFTGMISIETFGNWTLGIPCLIVYYAWMICILFVAEKVSVSYTAAAMAFVPVIGFLCQMYVSRLVVWRLTMLPYRDWPIEGDNVGATGWRQIPHPKNPNARLYTKQPVAALAAGLGLAGQEVGRSR